MSIGPKLCLIKSITSESGTIKYLCMIPILFYQVYGNSNVKKGISVITGLLINKLDLICSWISGINLELPFILSEFRARNHKIVRSN
jgi:hypothetical protein